MSPRDPAANEKPEVVASFAGILADWLASFTMPAPLGAEMADALEAGSDWVGAIASTSVRRAGWPDAESVAWGICVAALSGALEAARRSLDGAAGRRDPGATADGPARALLAADGLIAAAHETLAALGEERLRAAMDALEEEFGDGGPWRGLAGPAAGSTVAAGPSWPAFVALALAPAAADPSDGAWTELAAAWRRRYALGRVDGAPGSAPTPGCPDDEDLFRHPEAEESTAALLRAAAAAARRPGGNGALAGA